MTLDLMRHFGTRQRRSGSRQEASAFAAAALRRPAGQRPEQWRQGGAAAASRPEAGAVEARTGLGKEGEGQREAGDELTIGEVLPSTRPCCLLAYCRWFGW